MSPFETIDGKRRWKPPTAEQRAERGLSTLTPTQTGYVPPSPTAQQVPKPTLPTAEVGRAEVPFRPTAQPQYPQSILPQIPEEQLAEKDKSFWNKVKDWYGRVFPQPTTTYEQQQAISREEYAQMSDVEKLKYGAETTIMAGAFGGQISYAVNFATNSISNYFMGKAVGEATKGLTKYSTAPGGVSPKELLYKNIYGATNVKTKGLLTKQVGKVLREFKKPASVKNLIFTAIGLTSLGEWGRGDALEGIDYTMTQAIETGDKQLIRDTRAIVDELDNPDLWEKMLRVTPGAGVVPGLYQRWKSHKAKKKVNDFLADRLLKGDVKDLSDFNQERLDVEAEVIRLREEADKRRIQRQQTYEAGIREARAKADEDSRLAWLSYKAEVQRLDKLEREAIALFWLEYIKQKKRLLENYGRSTLGFGLFR